MTIALAVVILIVVGGAIAFAGDWIGTRVGKKRLSFMKMRPRDTARVFTVSFGSLVALITFFILFLADKSFQIALQQGAEIITRNLILTSANRRLAAAASQEQTELTEAQTASAAAQSQLTGVNLQLKSAQAAVSKADAYLDTLQSKLSRDQSQVASLLERASVLTAENTQADERLNRSKTQLMAHSEGTLIYRSEQEVGRCVIDSGQPIASIRAQIYAFLSQLNQDAQSHGAAGVQLFKIAIFSGSDIGGGAADQSPLVVSEKDNVDALAQTIHEGKVGKVAVIATALGNAYDGGQAVVMLHPYVDRLVIPAGSELATLTIPDTDRQSSASLLRDLLVLLEIARGNAIRAGMIPLENPQIKQAEIINVSYADLYQVVDQIRTSTGPAVVVVTAIKDTYSADHPLDLRFTVDGNDVHPT